MKTVDPRFPTSAPGPPPRVRVASGLPQPSSATARSTQNVPRRPAPISNPAHVLGREHEDHAQEKPPDQDEDGGDGGGRAEVPPQQREGRDDADEHHPEKGPAPHRQPHARYRP